MFTADQVWALAVAADRINQGYYKYPVHDQATGEIATRENKSMVKAWLQANDFSVLQEGDLEKGSEIRHYFKGLLLKELSGKINDFERSVLKIAQKDEFTGRDMLDFAIISSLPEAQRRDILKKGIDASIRDSEQLAGNEGDRVVGSAEVYRSYFSENYLKYRIFARMGDSYVDFWYPKDLKGTVTVKGKIKTQRGDKTTQLNYVKIA